MPKPPTSRSLTYVASLARCHTEKAIEVLFGIMTNPDASYLARMRAAKILLNRSGRLPVPPAMSAKASQLVRQSGWLRPRRHGPNGSMAGR
jgi:hypothetical protein